MIRLHRAVRKAGQYLTAVLPELIVGLTQNTDSSTLKVLQLLEFFFSFYFNNYKLEFKVFYVSTLLCHFRDCVSSKKRF
jgi:hypothetical protein